MNNLTRPLFTFFLLICVAWTVAIAQPRTSGTPTSSTTKAKPEVLTNATIIELAQLGLSEAIMLEKDSAIRRHFDTSVTGLNQLKAAKISDAVIAVMMNPSAKAAPPALVAQPAPVPALVQITRLADVQANTKSIASLPVSDSGIYAEGRFSK